jgi:hypothetical protein
MSYLVQDRVGSKQIHPLGAQGRRKSTIAFTEVFGNLPQSLMSLLQHGNQNDV